MGSGRYKLAPDGKTPIECEDLMDWVMTFQEMDRRVNMTILANGYRVSTIFMGLDFNFANLLSDVKRKPILWESIVWKGDEIIEQERYSSYDDALAGHFKLVKQFEEKPHWRT